MDMNNPKIGPVCKFILDPKGSMKNSIADGLDNIYNNRTSNQPFPGYSSSANDQSIIHQPHSHGSDLSFSRHPIITRNITPSPPKDHQWSSQAIQIRHRMAHRIIPSLSGLSSSTRTRLKSTVLCRRPI